MAAWSARSTTLPIERAPRLHFQRSGSTLKLPASLDKVSTLSCSVACSCMLRWASLARACASAAGMRQTLSLSCRATLPSMPPDLRRAAEGVDDDGVGLAAGLGQRLVLGLANLDPQALAAGEVGQHDVGLVGAGQARAKADARVAPAQGLHFVRVQGQRDQAHHHAFVGFARMARQRQRMVGVVAVVDVGDRQIGFEDGGFQRHGALPGAETLIK